MIRTFLAAIAAVLLSSCATANFDTQHKLGDVRGISGAQVYIYSFLDVRDGDLGARMVGAVNEQIGAQLAAHGVESALVTYRETDAARYTARSGSVMIPVEDIIASQLPQEEALGADYRLIIVPSEMMIYGANQSYVINWDLIDVRTGSLIWTTSLRGNRTIWWAADEDSTRRAQIFVNGVIEQMASSGLFQPFAPGPVI